MFSCGLAETTAQQVELKATPLTPFKLVLGYLYCGKLDLAEITESEDLAGLLGLAHQYQLEALATAVAGYMAGKICTENVLLYLVHAQAYLQRDLENACLAYLDRNTDILTWADGLDLIDQVSNIPRSLMLTVYSTQDQLTVSVSQRSELLVNMQRGSYLNNQP